MGEIFSGCPGADRFKNPTLEERVCPVCGNIIEIFSVDVSVKCDHCGFEAFNDLQSCVKWCKFAEQCIGTELYHKLVMKTEETENEA